MQLDPSTAARGRLAIWPWVVAFLPAFVLLLMILRMRVPAPYADSWAYVGQYRDWLEGDYGWDRLIRKHGDHPSVVGKTIYFSVFHWLHGDVGLLPVLNWIFSAAIAIGVCILSRPLANGSRTRGPWLMLCASLTIFSATLGGMWIWDFAFQDYIPGVCLVAGLVVLSGGEPGRWRIVAAALLSLVATFSFGSGFLVGVLLSLPLWHGTGGRSTARRCLATGAWLAFVGVAAWIALSAPGPPGRPLSVMVLLDRPLVRLQFVCILLGQMLGKGTAFEPLALSAVWGGVFLMVFTACLVFILHHRRNPGLVSASVPWIACSLFGLANAVLICVGRLGKSPDSFHAFNSIYALAERTIAERFIVFTQFFVWGTVFLVAAVLRHAGDAAAPVRLMRRLGGAVLVVFFATHVVNWQAGWKLMKLENALMKQERAMLAFGQFVPLDPERLWNSHTRNQTFALAKSLADKDRLRSVPLVTDNRISAFKLDKKIPGKLARFDKPGLPDDGGWRLAGFCRGINQDDSNLPDLILISAESPGQVERIIAVATPTLPESFFESRSQRLRYPEHYFGWSCLLDPVSLPKGQVTLRAYSFDPGSQSVRPLEGVHQLEPHPG